jgi:L,D-transpeptidase YcbB
MQNYRNTFICIACLAWIGFSCQKPPSVRVSYSNSMEQTVEIVEPIRIPPDSNSWIYQGLKRPVAVYQYYKSHQFALRWLKDSIPLLSDSMYLFLKNVRQFGLLPQDYHTSEIGSLGVRSGGSTRCRRVEVLLTDAFLTVAHDLKYGRLSLGAGPQHTDSLLIQILDQVFINDEVRGPLESLEPGYLGYQYLRRSLREMLAGMDPVDRALLISGVTNDSIVIHRKVQTIEVNLERWRNENALSGDRYIWINIPSYQLNVIDRGQTVISSRIIVGKPGTPSPVLSSLVECITLYPYWHVPRKIAVEEFLPAIQRDTSFLTLNNFDVLDRKGRVVDPDTLNWKQYNRNKFPFTLRQREGKENSLGVIKFVFDNPYAVFLHDTNAKGLFKKSFRAFSHGCIRMEKAVDLAKYLVPEPARIDKILDSKVRQTVNVGDPIPIYIRYFTCEVVDGNLAFYDDIYAQDPSVIQVLYDRSPLE